jgi:hypothetical protein
MKESDSLNAMVEKVLDAFFWNKVYDENTVLHCIMYRKKQKLLSF